MHLRIVSTTACICRYTSSIFTGMVPVSLWGIGTRDGALAYFMQGITSPEIAISAGCLYTALVYWLLGLIGTPFLLFAKMKNQ